MSSSGAQAIDPRYQYIRLRPDGKAPIRADAGFGERGADTWVRRPISTIREWLESGGNVAVLTGKRSGHICVDVDPAGIELAETFDWPATLTISTPRGGYHLIFRYPSGFERVHNDTHGIVFGDGIDLKADYGYRVAPPSSSTRGSYAVVHDVPPAECPNWLVERLVDREARRRARQSRSRSFEKVDKVATPDPCCSDAARSSVAAILRTMDQLSALPDGGRMRIHGKQVGWDGGYWLLAARLVEIARWPHTRYSLTRAHRDFMKHAPQSEYGFDPDHAWDQGSRAATEWAAGNQHRLDEHAPPVTTLDASRRGISSAAAASTDSHRPYSVMLSQETLKFAREFADRTYRRDGVLTLRWHPEEQDWWEWDEAAGHYILRLPDVVAADVGDRMIGLRQTARDASTCEVNVNNRTTGELVNALKRTVTVTGSGDRALLPARGGIPFRNGWLETQSGLLVPCGPHRDVRWVIPANFDAGADCPEWLAFLESLELHEDELRLLRQWYGYLLSGRVDLHKALMLVGPKRAGKGTLIGVAEALLGDGAAATSLESFDPRNSFGLANLVGKSLGVIGEARWGRDSQGRNEMLLRWISADSVPVNVKYKPVETIVPEARLMIASNELPRFFDAGGALASRFVVVELQRSFYRSEDFNLRPRLLAELAGIANWAMAGLADLSEVGRLSETGRGREIEHELELASSPERQFLEELCELNREARTEKNELFAAYCDWCVSERVSSASKAVFFRKLNAAFPGMFTSHRGRDRDRTHFIQGVRLVKRSVL